MNRIFALAASLIITSCSLSVAVAADSPQLSIEQTALTANTVTYTINAQTGTDGISAVEVFLGVPSGMTLTKEQTVGSLFDTEVIKAVQTGQKIHIARATLVNGGIHNKKVEVSALTFAILNPPTTVPLIDESASTMIRYSDSTNVLHPVVAVQQNAQPIHHRYLYSILLAGVVLVGAILLWYRNQH